MNGVDPRWNGKNSDGGNVNNNAAVTTKGYPGLGDRVAPPHPPPPQSFRQSSSPLMQQRREQASLSPTDDFGPGMFRSVSPGPQQGFDGRVNGNGNGKFQFPRVYEPPVALADTIPTHV